MNLSRNMPSLSVSTTVEQRDPFRADAFTLSASLLDFHTNSTTFSSKDRPSKQFVTRSARTSTYRNEKQATTTTSIRFSQQHRERAKPTTVRMPADEIADESVLRVARRVSPLSLKSGVPPQAAARIRELHVPLASPSSSELLPEWLDVIAGTFFHLQHLYLEEKEGVVDGTSEAARMRRLYVLYRLPDLLSIDGIAVTPMERQVARPNDPNGQRVRRTDWVHADMPPKPTRAESLLDDFDESDDEDDFDDYEHVGEAHGGAVEVSMSGLVRKIKADRPLDDWDEPALERPHQPSKEQEKLAREEADLMEVNLHSKLIEMNATISLRKEKMRRNEAAANRSCGVRAPIPGLGACTRNSKYLAVDEELTTLPFDGCKHNLTKTQDPAGSPKGYARSQKVALTPSPKSSPRSSPSTPPSPKRPPSPSLSISSSTPGRRLCGSPKGGAHRISPSRSLSSPFPMQFRNRGSPPPGESPVTSPLQTSTNVGHRISFTGSPVGDEKKSDEPDWKDIELPRDFGKRMETIDLPGAATLVPLTISQQKLAGTSMSNGRTASFRKKGELPPIPASLRRSPSPANLSVNKQSNHLRRMERKQRRLAAAQQQNWRNGSGKGNRSTSIFDNEEDDDEFLASSEDEVVVVSSFHEEQSRSVAEVQATEAHSPMRLQERGAIRV